MTGWEGRCAAGASLPSGSGNGPGASYEMCVAQNVGRSSARVRRGVQALPGFRGELAHTQSLRRAVRHGSTRIEPRF